MPDPEQEFYVLPNSPTQRCLDRFSILDGAEEDADGLVAFWPILEETLRKPVGSMTQLIDVLDTIANTLRDSSGDAGDYGSLAVAVERFGSDFFHKVWPTVVAYALSLPTWFPSGSRAVLTPGDEVNLSREEVASLVAHQFLCSLASPRGRDGFYDFSIWYNSEQRHPKAVEMYLYALLRYLEKLPALKPYSADSSAKRDRVRYSLHAHDAKSLFPEASNQPLSDVQVIQVEEYTTETQELSSQGPHSAVIVSANKHIGFGQSATQEELFVGNCPEACPAVLFTAELKPNEALVVEGAEPMLRIQGQRRDTSWEELSTIKAAAAAAAGGGVGGGESKDGARMLFMDALEMDEMGDDGHGLADLRPMNLEREINKAYTAFSSWGVPTEQHGGREGGKRPLEAPAIWTGVWGCGAFNGDPGVKMVILWIAASMAGRKKLIIMCDPLHRGFAIAFGEFVRLVASKEQERDTTDTENNNKKTWGVRDLRMMLDKMPRETERLKTVEWMLTEGLKCSP